VRAVNISFLTVNLPIIHEDELEEVASDNMQYEQCVRLTNVHQRPRCICPPTVSV
jgi:hypothetical protein